MKKAGKIVGILAAVVILLMVVLLVLAQVLITPERVKSFVIPRAEEALQREVLLSNVDVSIFSGIRLQGLVVQEKEGEEPFVSADEAVLSYKFWPLLARRVIIDEARLINPRIRIERFEDGTFNFSDLAETQEEPRPDRTGGEEEGLPMDLLVSEVSLSGGEVVFLDHKLAQEAPYRYRISDLRLAAEGISLEEPFPFEGEARMGEGSLNLKGRIDPKEESGQVEVTLSDFDVVPFTPYFGEALPGQLNAMKVNLTTTIEGNKKEVQSKGQLNLENIDFILEMEETGERITVQDSDLGLDYDLAANLSEQILNVQQATLSFNTISMGIKGEVWEYLSQPKISFGLTVDDLDLREALRALPKELTEPLAEFDPAGKVTAQATLEGDLEAPEELLRSAEVQLVDVVANVAEQRASLTGGLLYADEVVKSDNLVLAMGENSARIELLASNLFGEIIAVESHIRSERFALDPLLKTAAAPAAIPGEEGQQPSDGPPQEDEAVTPIDLPVKAEGTVQIGETLYRGLTLQDFSLRYRLVNNVLTVERMTGKVAGGTVSTQARVDLGEEEPQYSSVVQIQGLQSDPLIAAFFPKAKGTVLGTLNLESRLQGTGLKAETIKRHLSAKGNALLLNGQLTGAGLVRELADFLNLEELRVMQFSEFKGNYTVENGKVRINSDFDGEQVRMKPQGTISLDGDLDLSLNAEIAPDLMTKLNVGGSIEQFVTGSEGWGQLPIQVVGTVSSPRFVLDTTEIRERLQEKAGQELQRGLERSLKRLLPGEKAPGPTEDSGEQQPSQAPAQKQLEEALKGIFGN